MAGASLERRNNVQQMTQRVVRYTWILSSNETLNCSRAKQIVSPSRIHYTYIERSPTEYSMRRRRTRQARGARWEFGTRRSRGLADGFPKVTTNLHYYFYCLSFYTYLFLREPKSSRTNQSTQISIMSAHRYDREPAYNNRRPSNPQYRGDRNGRMYEDQYYDSRSRDRYRRSRSPRERYSSPHGKP